MYIYIPKPETPHQVRDALSCFQSIDTDRNGVISKEEFAEQMHLSHDDVKVPGELELFRRILKYTS